MPLAAPPVPSMSYSSMIEEKNLKKTFIVATLVSTLIGTFTSSHNLYERLGEKRKQHKKDESQNDAIKELKDEIQDLKKGGKGGKNDGRDDSRGRGRDAIADSLGNSGAMIQREFENGYAHLGNRFAGGDLVTENALQKQIIQLQQTVINVLQDAVNSGRQLSQRDVDRLVMASDLARDNTLDALRQQYQRQSGPEDRRMSLPAPPPSERRMITNGDDFPPPKRTSTAPAPSLYCSYSLDLQDMPRRALAGAFDHGRGDGCCPDCHIRVNITSQDRWKIRKRLPVLVTRSGRQEEITEEHVFEIGPRFIVKCHTESGGYACILCNKTRDFDAVCKDPEVLVSHVGKAHNMEEYRSEIDIVEL